MRKCTAIVKTAGSALLAAGMIVSLAASAAEEPGPPELSVEEEGKAIAFDRTKGNCLACHQMDDGELPGNIGPPLIAMKARYPDKAKLRAQVWDATKVNSNTVMPPFGRQQIISESEIDKVIEYIYTL